MVHGVRRLVVVLMTAFLVCFGAAPAARAQETADVLLAKLAAADPDLRTYRADVAFDIGLHSFPYVRKTVHGNAYFKRPARMELVFRDLPPIARAFRNLSIDLGTPGTWAAKYAIAAATERVGDREVSYLVLTPLRASRRLREVDIYLDEAAALPHRIVWRYDDGRIEMHQRFARVQGHDLVVAQDTDIRLPAVHAYVNTRISNYAINIEVDDRVFTPRASPSPAPETRH
jgi:hypothetical protein